MSFEKTRCGECGTKDAFVVQNVKCRHARPWKDFPVAYITRDLELWVCNKCGNVGYPAEKAKEIDEAIEGSIKDQARQFIDIIKSRSRFSIQEIARRLGVSYTHLSTIHSGANTPSFQLWNELKAVAMDPQRMMEMLDPSRNPVDENIMLRA